MGNEVTEKEFNQALLKKASDLLVESGYCDCALGLNTGLEFSQGHYVPVEKIDPFDNTLIGRIQTDVIMDHLIDHYPALFFSIGHRPYGCKVYKYRTDKLKQCLIALMGGWTE